MADINLSAEELKTLMGTHLMFWGFPFCATTKPELNERLQAVFDSLDDKLHATAASFATSREKVPEEQRGDFRLPVDFTDQEIRVMQIAFDALAEEFPPTDDYELTLHVPSREVFDTLHQQIKGL